VGKLIAVVGFAGAGKTTAIGFLEGIGAGRRVYVGQLVLNEAAARKLPPGPESEESVRLDLRQKYGLAALAVLAAPSIQRILKDNSNVLLDAILSPEELLYYRTHCDENLELIAITAPFEVRAQRLEVRSERKFTVKDLRKRDAVEATTLGTDRVISAANICLSNSTSIPDFRVCVEGYYRGACGPQPEPSAPREHKNGTI
jgi:dephospho-CoA kinase